MIIKGYHGTNVRIAHRVKREKNLQHIACHGPLGHGIYFFARKNRSGAPDNVILKRMGSYTSGGGLAVVSADMHVVDDDVGILNLDSDLAKSVIDKTRNKLEQQGETEKEARAKAIRLTFLRLERLNKHPALASLDISVVDSSGRVFDAVCFRVIEAKIIDKTSINYIS